MEQELYTINSEQLGVARGCNVSSVAKVKQTQPAGNFIYDLLPRDGKFSSESVPSNS